jgi:hypothetical protein
MKRIATGVLITVIALTLVGCGMNNSTVLDAAKTFTQAQINGDSKVIQEIDRSGPLAYPAQYVLSLASTSGYSKHNIDEFKFEQVNDTTANVLGPKDIGDKSLSFVKENGKYYFDSMGGVQETQVQVQAEQQAAKDAAEKTAQEVAQKIDYLVGEWDGEYTAGQGNTSLILNISKGDNGELQATFNFGPTSDNPKIPQGSFKMIGSYDANSQILKFQGAQWIQQPNTYVMVDMIGTIDATNNIYKGTLPNTGEFEVTKKSS